MSFQSIKIRTQHEVIEQNVFTDFLTALLCLCSCIHIIDLIKIELWQNTMSEPS